MELILKRVCYCSNINILLVYMYSNLMNISFLNYLKKRLYQNFVLNICHYKLLKMRNAYEKYYL